MGLIDKVELDQQVCKGLVKKLEWFGAEKVTDLIQFFEQNQTEIPKAVKISGWASFIVTPLIRRQITKLVVRAIVLLIKLKILIEEEK